MPAVAVRQVAACHVARQRQQTKSGLRDPDTASRQCLGQYAKYPETSVCSRCAVADQSDLSVALLFYILDAPYLAESRRSPDSSPWLWIARYLTKLAEQRPKRCPDVYAVLRRTYAGPSTPGAKNGELSSFSGLHPTRSRRLLDILVPLRAR